MPSKGPFKVEVILITINHEEIYCPKGFQKHAISAILKISIVKL